MSAAWSFVAGSIVFVFLLFVLGKVLSSSTSYEIFTFCLKACFGTWLYCFSWGVDSFYNTAAYETRVVLILYRLKRPGRSVLGRMVCCWWWHLYHVSPVLFWLYSKYKPFSWSRWEKFFSILVTEGRFLSFSFNPEYIVSSSMLWIGIMVVLWMNVFLNYLVFDSVWIRNINESIWNEVDGWVCRWISV